MEYKTINIEYDEADYIFDLIFEAEQLNSESTNTFKRKRVQHVIDDLLANFENLVRELDETSVSQLAIELNKVEVNTILTLLYNKATYNSMNETGIARSIIHHTNQRYLKKYTRIKAKFKQEDEFEF